MKSILLRLSRPILERVGTMIAAYLIARGVDSDLAAQLMNGAMAIAFLVLDTLTSSVYREHDEKRLYAEIYDRMTKEVA